MILLAVYISVKGLDAYEEAQYMRQSLTIIEDMTKKIPGVRFFMIPTRENNSRIECIYPRFISFDSDEFKKELIEYTESMKLLSEQIKKNLPEISSKTS